MQAALTCRVNSAYVITPDSTPHMRSKASLNCAGSGSFLQFQADADEAAKLARVDQLGAAVAARPSLATVAAILEALSQALHDTSPAVLKRAIPAAYVAFR